MISVLLYLSQVIANDCFGVFEESFSLSKLSEPYHYSGKGVNEQGKIDSCLRAGMNYFTLATSSIIPASIGICVPAHCNKSTIAQSVSKYEVLVEELPNYKISTNGFIFFSVLLIWILACILSTLAEFLYPQTKSSKLIQIFSSSTGYSQLFKARNKNDLACIDGVRVLSFFMVMYGHVNTFKAFSPLINVEEFAEIFQHWWGVLAYTGLFAVDVFFILSGFLLAYFLMIELNKKEGKIVWSVMYVHRVLRILPTMMVILGIDYFLVPSLNSSPNWKYFKEVVGLGCDKYWWTNALFINNFYPEGHECFSFGWYLANDMQFFVVGSVIVYGYYKVNRKHFLWIFTGLCFVALFLLSFWIAKHFGLGLGPLDEHNFDNGYDTVFNYFYIRPYVRFPPYLQGLILGILYFNYKNPGVVTNDIVSKWIIKVIDQSFIAQFIVVVGGLVMMATAVSIQYPVYNDPLNSDVWSREKNAFVMAYIRFGFTCGLVLVLLATLMKKVWIIGAFLSFPGSEPISKLAYSGYLVHVTVVSYLNMSAHHSFISGINVFRDWVLCTVFTLILAVFSFVWLEIPFQNIEVLLFGHLNKRKPKFS